MSGFTLTGFTLTAEERSAGDCMRVAVTQCYGAVHDFTYQDTPDLAIVDEDGGLRPGSEQQVVWEAWALERGLRWWMSYELAPVHLAAWIGSVDSRGYPGAEHAIAFSREKPLVPDEGTAYGDVTVKDVRVARWLLPAGVGMPAGRMRRIERPHGGEPRGIVAQDASGTWQWAMRG